MTTQVSTSSNILYGVRTTVSPAEIFSIQYGVRVVISPANSFSIQYAVRQSVVNLGYSIVYSVRMITPQDKVFTVLYGVRQTLSKNEPIAYGVRVPVAVPTTFTLMHGVRKLASYSPVIVYNTTVTGKTTVSQSVVIFYHTLIKTSGGVGGAFSTAFSNAYDSGVGTVKPSVDLVIAIPAAVDPVPPQVVTTSF